MSKFRMYEKLKANTANIFADAKKAADEIGIPAELRGKFGLTGAISGCPAPLRRDVQQAMQKGLDEVIPLATLVDQIRDLVKEVYGDEYDAAPISTCEAGLWVSFDSLFTPPNQGRGDNYRARYIAPFEKHMHHQAGYGRPFPPRFKDFLADRGSTAGELGFYGKRQNNTDVVVVPLEGAEYPNHGIKSWPVPFMTTVDAEKSIEKVAKVAERHANSLTGITSLGYETPGYGYEEKDADGISVLQKGYAAIAKDFDIPYVIDNAWGLPFVGTDITKNNADAYVYSMDKATGSATSGLIIGKEDVMVPIRRAMGMHGDRWGTTSSYGKAAYVGFDPGKEALLGQIAALKVLKDNPALLTDTVDELYDVVKDEFSALDAELLEGIVITKTYNSNAVEVNYEGTWANGKKGIPVFSIEDMYNGSHLLQNGLAQMGVIPTIAYDGNILISPGLATTDEDGKLIEQNARWAVRAIVRIIQIICDYAHN